MRYFSKIKLSLCCVIAFGNPAYTQLVRSTSGNQIIIHNSGYFVLNNMGLHVDGTFSPGGGTVVFTGNASTANTVIKGSGSTSFYNLVLNKTANGIQLERNIAISNILNLTNGDSLFLNTYSIDLGSGGQVTGEVTGRSITGYSGGYVYASRIMNSPFQENPGNLGLVITTSANLGMTTVRRGHQRQSDGLDIGVSRYYDVVPTNNSGLNATLTLNYLDNELAGVSEGSLTLFMSPDEGANWYLMDYSDRNSTLNYVQQTGVNQMNRFTLGSSDDPLPVHFVYIKASNQEGKSLIQWKVTNQDVKDIYLVERSVDGLHFLPQAQIYATRVFDKEQEYSWVDELPGYGSNFYRIRQLEPDGSFTLSAVCHIRHTSALLEGVAVYPNPVMNMTQIQIKSVSERWEDIFLVDLHGRRLEYKRVLLKPGLNSIAWDLSQYRTGLYVFQLRSGGQTNRIIKH